MFRFTNLASFIVLTSIIAVSADVCNYNGYVYYCSFGQSCGSYINDCRGLPTYAIIAIVSISVMVLSICIRCCIYANAGTMRPVRRRAPILIRNQGMAQGPVNSCANNYGPRPATIVPVHTVIEDAPPSYATATTSGLPKY